MDAHRARIKSIGATPIGLITDDFAQETGPQSYSDGQVLTLAGMVESVKTKTTKNNTLMSYVQLEDSTGAIELIVFQRALDQGGQYLNGSEPIAVKGKISVRDEKEPQFMVDAIYPLSETPAEQRKEKTLYVKVPSQDDEKFTHVEKLKMMYPGREKMVIYCEKEKKQLGTRCLIHDEFIEELRSFLGDGCVVVK